MPAPQGSTSRPVPAVSTRVAQAISDEPGEQSVVYLNLAHELPRDAITATRAGRGLSAGDGGRNDVFTGLAPVLEISAFAILAVPTDGDFVDGGEIVLAGDEPNLLRRVEADLGTVRGVEVAASLDSGGGLVRWLRYPCGVH